MIGGHCFKKLIWIFIQSVCVLSFIAQMCLLAQEQLNPSQTETFLEEKKLDDIEFPVLFKVCFKNSFNLKNLEEAGYSSVWNYFMGVSMHNKSNYGWAGHRQDGGVGLGVPGIPFFMRVLFIKLYIPRHKEISTY